MRTIAAGFQTLLDARTGRFAHIVRVTRKDGTVIRLTDAKANVVVPDDGTYVAKPGVIVGDVTKGVGGDSDSVDIDIPVGGASNPITKAAVIAGFYDHATIELVVVNPDDPSVGQVPISVAMIADIDYDDAGRARFDIVGLWGLAIMLRMRTFGPGCGTELGHPVWCKVDMAGYTVPATVASVISSLAFTITHAEARAVDDWFTRGAGKFGDAPDGGANANKAFDVRKWTAATDRIDLWVPMPGAVQVGDTLQIHAGCQLTLADCRDKFDNLEHFQGFPHLPDVPFGSYNVEG